MLLSIIIPIYNKEKYLSRAINSIFSQNLKEGEFELILIDDGSKDSSLSICYLFKKKYPTIVTVISKANEGSSKTRDLGILSAKGDFIYFMDADDFLIPGGLRYVIDHFLNYNYDIIVFYSSTIANFDENTIPKGTINGDIVFDGDGCEFLKHGFHSFVWNQIYKLDFIKANNISFNDMYLCEDVFFNLQIWTKNPKVRISSSRIYRYIDYPDTGQLTKNRDNAYLKKSINSYMRLFEYISSLSKPFKQEYNSNNLEIIFQNVLLTFISRILCSNLKTKDYIQITNKMKDWKLLPLKNIQSYKDKTIDFMFRYNRLFPIYKILYKNIIVPYIILRISRESGSIFN